MEKATNAYDLMIAIIQQQNLASSEDADDAVKTFKKLIKAII